LEALRRKNKFYSNGKEWHTMGQNTQSVTEHHSDKDSDDSSTPLYWSISGRWFFAFFIVDLPSYILQSSKNAGEMSSTK